MVLKIKRLSNEKIYKEIKFWKAYYILSIFFIFLSILGGFFSEGYILLLIIVCIIPLFIGTLTARNELNYYRTILEIRKALENKKGGD